MALSNDASFDRGQQVPLRDFRSNGRLIAVESARVVEDGPRGTLPWIGPGMPCVIRKAVDGHHLHGAGPAELAATATTLFHYDFPFNTGHPPFHTTAEAEAVRAEGLRLIGEAEAGRFPFDGTWCDFEPDPSWTPSPLPDGRDRPAVWKAAG